MDDEQIEDAAEDIVGGLHQWVGADRTFTAGQISDLAWALAQDEELNGKLQALVRAQRDQPRESVGGAAYVSS